jgi:hypothetical protein
VKKSVIGSALVLGIAVAVAGPSLGGCGSNPGGTSGSSGSQAPGLDSYGKISTLLTLPGGETITSVNWTINQGTTVVLSGTYAVPASATSISFFIPNVPSGSGYTLTLSATSPDGAVSCVGTSAPFSVTAQQTTDVNVFLACTNTSTDGGADSGGVLVTGTPVNCATWTSAAATPATAIAGASVELTASAVAPQSSAITYTWTASAGTITPLTSGTTAAGLATFVCPATPASVTITLTVGDGAVPTGYTCPAASSVTTLTVTCGAVPCENPTVGTGVEATPDTAAGTCPAGQTNSTGLKDGSGNYCCTALPCFGVGTGVEATPDTAAGTCPAGSGNTAKDAAGNFCCATIAACTTSGQTGCVQCQGSAGGACTPTEAAFVNYDIAKGFATVAGPDPAAGCYTCLVSKLGLDATTNPLSGSLECGDLTGTGDTGSADCLATLNCIIGSSPSCASVATNACYCGTQPVSGACSTAGGNGVCAAQEAAGLGLPVTSGQAILEAYGSTTLSSGVANNIFQTALSNGCTQCP